MSEEDKGTEELIFEAAQTVFVQKGFDGTRMEEIARVAGINKSLLHYYYRTKEKLFNAIFKKAFSYFMPKVLSTISSDLSFDEKIKIFTATYVEVLLKNPHIPIFILNELNRNPDNAAQMIGELTGIAQNDTFGKFSALIQEEIDKGNIRSIEPEQLIVNLIGLCIFPFAARPIVQGIVFKNDKKRYNEFLEKRKTEIANFVLQSIKIEK
ncbi:MAG: TetR/AcrR family transcriptional regulator [Bacteroidota bacterium]|nr:TetR/AcrR family transcriptional regulator [Bacteroidota bacterium]